MSSPVGNYTFAGLGFTNLYLTEGEGKFSGSLYAPGSTTELSGVTYTDATGVVTFSAGESPAGVTDLNFTGNIIPDLNGNVLALAGTWTGRSRLTVSAKPAAPAAPAASAHAAPAIRGIGPVPILQAHGWWAACDRQPIIE